METGKLTSFHLGSLLARRLMPLPLLIQRALTGPAVVQDDQVVAEFGVRVAEGGKRSLKKV